MREFLKKILVLFFIFNLTFAPVFAKDNLKMYGNIQNDFSVNNVPERVSVKIKEEKILPDGTVIPKGAMAEFEVMQVQRERRWHKSGYILCKLRGYTVITEHSSVEDNIIEASINEDIKDNIDKNVTEEELVKGNYKDLSDKNIYLAIRKHEPIEGKEAIILTIEIVVTQSASIVGSCFIFFAPVDIAYFFTRGAIRREKHHNWFKAGVYDAYDNSIFWFWLKGKPIEMQDSQDVKIQGLSEKKAMRLNGQIAKRNEKFAAKEAKKQAKLEVKEEKRQIKLDQLKEKNPEKYERKIAKQQAKQEKYEARVAHEIEVQQAIFAKRAAKKQQRLERKQAKQALKQEKKELKLARKADKKAAKAAKKEKQESI